MKALPKLILCATLMTGLAAHALTREDMFGRSVSAATPARTVVINAMTRYLNVKQGDVLTLRDGEQSVTWLFDGLREAVPLAEIWPAAPDAAHVIVYVEITPHD
jgi:hypothetical protein